MFDLVGAALVGDMVSTKASCRVLGSLEGGSSGTTSDDGNGAARLEPLLGEGASIVRKVELRGPGRQ
eukprot:10502226-Alexandrium_andersonii.AAC.1